MDSLIPLTVASGASLQGAIDGAVADIDSSIQRFDQAAMELLYEADRQQPLWRSLFQYIHSFTQWKSPTGNQNTKDALEAFLTTSRQNCTGNLAWRLVHFVPRADPRACN